MNNKILIERLCIKYNTPLFRYIGDYKSMIEKDLESKLDLKVAEYIRSLSNAGAEDLTFRYINSERVFLDYIGEAVEIKKECRIYRRV